MIVKTKEQLPEELANIPASKFNMKQADDVILDEEFKTEAVGFWKDAFLRLRKSKVSVNFIYCYHDYCTGSDLCP